MSENESPGDKARDIGLKAVREARLERRASKHGRISGSAWLAGLGFVAVVIVGAWQYRERSLDNQKAELLSKQRAALTTVGAEWLPIRDALEKVTLEGAASFKGDFVDPEVAKWDFRTLPGIYLRMRVEDAKDVASLRKNARDSARDSFVGCLLRENNPSMAALARGGEADAGADVGWRDQPWNLRLAYTATRIIEDEWVSEVKNAEDEIHLRVFVQQYEKSREEEIPLAVEIVKRAQFFLVALDEDVPEAKELAPDAGRNAGKVSERELQQVAHPVRVYLLKLGGTPREVVRLRLDADGDFRSAGGQVVRDPYTLSAMKRQVNNCALAQNVWAALKPGTTAEAKGDSNAKRDASAAVTP